MNNGTGEHFLSAGTVPYAFTEMIYSIGLHTLKTNLKAAAKFIIEGTRLLTEGRFSSTTDTGAARMSPVDGFAFVQGSSLEILIERFGLEVDPEQFRETFLNMVDYWKRKK